MNRFEEDDIFARRNRTWPISARGPDGVTVTLDLCSWQASAKLEKGLYSQPGLINGQSFRKEIVLKGAFIDESPRVTEKALCAFLHCNIKVSSMAQGGPL